MTTTNFLVCVKIAHEGKLKIKVLDSQLDSWLKLGTRIKLFLLGMNNLLSNSSSLAILFSFFL